ncbi:MAG: CPBP family intramembrane metalloprotease [Candidatus Thermoplasmatota archaeon]|jgi:membrane protease YdiL (CAAX protease family)|nr:CPBP family intramembrane metalloprotease [Candidatus Thermoplasmatota archaeon]
MDFKLEKPSHIFALLMLIGSFFLIFVLPIISLFLIDSQKLIENLEIPEFVTILTQLFIILILFILIPFAWYYFVNNLKFKEILKRIKFVSENIDKAFVWGVLAAIISFVVIFVFEFILIKLGQNPQDLSNIPDLQRLFSWPVLFFLITIQPIGEEIFFRGFLFEKIENFAGGILAIFFTAFLFGLAHISYGKIFPVLMPILMGIILGFIVLKTRNLYSAVIAHILFNITSLTLAYLGQYLLQQFALNL